MPSKFEILTNNLFKFAQKQSGCRSNSDIVFWMQNNADECIYFLRKKQNQRISLRIKILAYAVATHMDPDLANDILASNGLETLYVRNIMDMAVMRVLYRGGTASELCSLAIRLNELVVGSGDVYDHMIPGLDVAIGQFTCTHLDAYIQKSNTDVDGATLTEQTQRWFSAVVDVSDEDFLERLKTEGIIDHLCTIRDRTRREFSIGLRDYLSAVIDAPQEDEIDAIFMNSCDAKEASDFLTLPINLGSIISIANEFYCDTFLSEGSLIDDSEDDCNQEIGDYEPIGGMQNGESWYLENSTDYETLYDQQVDKAKKRAAHLLQGFLHGTNDISRTFFISMMLFFNNRLPHHKRSNSFYFNRMLRRCGWPRLGFEDNSFENLAQGILQYGENHIKSNDYELYNLMLDDLQDPVFLNYAGQGSTASRNQELRNTL